MAFQTLETKQLLELVVEPLYVLLNQWTDGAVRYPSDQIDELWKGLLEGRDASDLLYAAEELRTHGLGQLAQRISREDFDEYDYLLTVVNPLPYERAETVEADLFLLDGDGYEAFGLCDEEGRSVDYDLLETTGAVSPDGKQGPQHRVRFRLRVPACGYRTLRTFRCETPVPVATKERPAPKGWVVQNEFMRVVVGADGKVDLLDSETGIESTDLFGFEGLTDQGEAVGPEILMNDPSSVRIVYPFGVSLILELIPGCRHLKVRVDVDSCCEDRRLRLLVHTDVHSDVSWSSRPFDCVRRRFHSEMESDRVEYNNGLISVRDWNHQLSVFNTGIDEYDHLRDKRCTIALSLTKDDSENQSQSYRLAVRPGRADEAALLREMQCFQMPLLSIFDAADVSRFASVHLMEDERVLPARKKGLALDSSAVFSALKRSFARDAWILRFFNPAETDERMALVLLNAGVSDFDEKQGAERWVAGTVVAPKEIVTLRF